MRYDIDDLNYRIKITETRMRTMQNYEENVTVSVPFDLILEIANKIKEFLNYDTN